MRTFLREGSVRVWASVEGFTGKPPVEAYPFQSLALAVEPYEYPWLATARCAAEISRLFGVEVPEGRRSGELKREGRRSPLGTSVAELARTGGDMLSAPCGYCGFNIARCRCGQQWEQLSDADNSVEDGIAKARRARH